MTVCVPEVNACLACPDFQTTVEFLGVHLAQAEQNKVLLQRAEAEGRRRLADNHRQVQANLERIIAALERIEGGRDDALTTPGTSCMPRQAAP